MNQNRINEIYQTLEEITFALPNFNTPDEITSSVFHCRERINKVEKLAIEVHRAIASARRVLLSKKKERQIKYSNFMRENEEVKKGKSGLDRQAIAESLLAGDDSDVSDLEAQMTELKYLNEATNLRISNLNKTNSDIRLAWSVMQNTSHVVSRDMTPQETQITPEDLEALDLTETSKETKSKELSTEDFSNVGFKDEVEKKSKKKEPEVDEDGFDLSSEKILDIEGEEVGDPVNLEEEKSKKEPKKEKKSKKEEKPKSDKLKNDEETFTDSSTSSGEDDVDIAAFLEDLE